MITLFNGGIALSKQKSVESATKPYSVINFT